MFIAFRGLTSFDEAANEGFFSPFCLFHGRIIRALAAHKNFFASVCLIDIYPWKLQ